MTSLEGGKRFEQESMKILSFRGEDGLACGTPFPEQTADRGTCVKRAPHILLYFLTEGEQCGVYEWGASCKNWQRYKPTEKNNKPHEERRNQEQHKTATPSFNAPRPQLTLIFYHLAGGQGIHNNPTALHVCFPYSYRTSVSCRKRLKGPLEQSCG